MKFSGVLFTTKEDAAKVSPVAPDFFTDLNLDQVVNAITAGREEYDLKPFFYTPLKDLDAVAYRHEIMRDLENDMVFGCIERFSGKFSKMRAHLDQVRKLHYKYQKEAGLLAAIEIYCEAVNTLAEELTESGLKSRGLLAFGEYISGYAQSEDFTALLAETENLKHDLSTIRYCVLIGSNRARIRRNAYCIEVSKYEAEIDYSIQVEETFAKFKEGAVKDYRAEFPEWLEMNHVEAGILNLVAGLHPDIFATLDSYCHQHMNYLDKTLSDFDREIQFYIAYLVYTARFKQAGLKFCYPELSDSNKEVHSEEGFDIALAGKLLAEGSLVVCNDFYLRDIERVLVVSGPNQGGKTTFARTFGQLHYLANLGCPVPGRKAGLFLYDKLFTHFEREENIQNLSGKLQDDLDRIHYILSRVTPHSIIIMNEIFTSTTLKDAVFLSKQIMGKIVQLGLLCVCVTFIDEMATFSDSTVSMVSSVVPYNTALRSFKIVRRPADGLAYAISIAEKYRLTYEYLKERIES